MMQCTLASIEHTCIGTVCNLVTSFPLSVTLRLTTILMSAKMSAMTRSWKSQQWCEANL